jgi:hypothetical protein
MTNKSMCWLWWHELSTTTQNWRRFKTCWAIQHEFPLKWASWCYRSARHEPWVSGWFIFNELILSWSNGRIKYVREAKAIADGLKVYNFLLENRHFQIWLRVRRSNFMRSKFNFLRRSNFWSWGRNCVCSWGRICPIILIRRPILWSWDRN